MFSKRPKIGFTEHPSRSANPLAVTERIPPSRARSGAAQMTSSFVYLTLGGTPNTFFLHSYHPNVLTSSFFKKQMLRNPCYLILLEYSPIICKPK